MARRTRRAARSRKANADSGRAARKARARKYMPAVFGTIVAVMFIGLGLTLPGFGPALPSTVEMWIVMSAIVVIGISTIIYSASKVLVKLDGNMAHGVSFMIGGLILFVAVTILDFPIHTDFIQFNQLTHTFWHTTELVGVIMFGVGLAKIAKAA